MPKLIRLPVIDTHTGGEPTRVVIESDIALEGETASDKLDFFRRELDHLRRSMTCEPRASDHWVAGWLFPSTHPDCEYGVIFMNNVGYLGMCGHGLIGVTVALAHQKDLPLGKHSFETCVGVVSVDLLGPNRVSIQNVPSYRLKASVPFQLSSGQQVHGDIAWGGNWFFLCDDHGLEVTKDNVPKLMQLSREIRKGLPKLGITGASGAEIDHIELFGPASDTAIADSRNFVLCPGEQYDRSPCGTGTSAKLACLAADLKLEPGKLWRQESIIGSVFEGSYQLDATGESPAVIPTIAGTAFVNAEAELLIDPADSFRFGVPIP